EIAGHVTAAKTCQVSEYAHLLKVGRRRQQCRVDSAGRRARPLAAASGTVGECSEEQLCDRRSIWYLQGKMHRAADWAAQCGKPLSAEGQSASSRDSRLSTEVRQPLVR